MAAETKIINWGKHRIAWVQSDDLDTAIELVRTGQVDGLGVSPYHGFKVKELDFLATVPGLQGVAIPFGKNFDLTPLKGLSGLKFLTVAENKQPFDYQTFRDLEDLNIQWHPKVTLPAANSKLRELYMRGYCPKDKTLKSLPAFKNVETLEITLGNLESLEGIKNLKKLSHASFFYLKQLQSVGALTRTRVKYLLLDVCKKIADVESLVDCHDLEVLRLCDCGKLRSLQFIRRFRKLVEFRFVNTIVEDGDLTPLLQLKSVGFLKRRGYSHTPEEIDEAIGAKADGG